MKRRNRFAGLALVGACALCCVLPLLGGAAVVGFTSFLFHPMIVLVLTLALLTGGIAVYRRRNRKGTACLSAKCACGSCSN